MNGLIPYDAVEHCFYQDDYRFPLGWSESLEKIDDDFVDGTW